jgi:oleate hydratase
MSTINSKFDKVLKASDQFGKVNHEPDSSKEVQINTPEKTMLFQTRSETIKEIKEFLYNPTKTVKSILSEAESQGCLLPTILFVTGMFPVRILFSLTSFIEGGSLDGAGNAKDGYIIRGGREMDMTYENLWDMFQDIPALELPAPYSVLDEYRLINDNDPNYSKARLIHKQGQIKDFSKFGLEKKISWLSSSFY